MAGAAIIRTACFRLPPDVDFQRWQGGDEWVIYHSGTGETIRVSDAALALLDLLATSGQQDQCAIERTLHVMIDAPISDQEMHAAVSELLRVLLNHECIEQVSCD
jgi:hypothetical protein